MGTPRRQSTANDRRPRNANGVYISKLTEDLIEKICDVVREGSSFETASQYAGVARSTFNLWMRNGRNGTGATRLERKLIAGLDQALAESKVDGIRRIRAAKDWRADAWWLERRFQDEFGPTTRGELKVEATTKHQLDLSKLSLDERRALLALTERASIGAGADVIELPAGDVSEIE